MHSKKTECIIFSNVIENDQRTRLKETDLLDNPLFIARYHNKLPDPETIQQIALLYSEVFGGHPWYEIYKCNSCESYFGQDTQLGQPCTCCASDYTTQAFPQNEIILMVENLFQNPGMVMHLLDADQVHGFAWGNLVNIEQTVSRFSDEQTRLAVAAEIARYTGGHEKFFTIAEIGCREELRGKGLGKLLLNTLLQDANAQNASATVWTRSDTILTPICLKTGFKQVFGPEMQILDGKAVGTGKVIVGNDPTTPERVMFILPANR